MRHDRRICQRETKGENFSRDNDGSNRPALAVDEGRLALDEERPTPHEIGNVSLITDRTSRDERQLSIMILPQVHLRKPCYDFYFL